MSEPMIGRERASLRAADDFLEGLAEDAAALVLEGEPGIGKTTLWAATIARAEQRGFRVLSPFWSDLDEEVGAWTPGA